MVDISGSGLVLGPGLVPPSEPLTPGPCRVVIEAVHPENGYAADGTPVPGEHDMVRCVYPGGFARSHQVKGVQDLLPKVVNQIRPRYGFAEAIVTAAPEALASGAAIELEVK